ncbi:hypothetical protein EYF80_005213 [Liparis tanakae]|uniref:Uncharacterized protein n=1 Tax=Liparis tanakae TaxID=230148 RepID=A0A4Z2J4U1_9TELE|nr:hypothetical protein EYF80_005213 [Liparis tanakae]
MSSVLVTVEHRVISLLHGPHVSFFRILQALEGLESDLSIDLQYLGGEVPNKEDILVSSQEGERELLLWLRDWWCRPELQLENLQELTFLEKKQPSSAGLGEHRSPNTLQAWSLSSVVVLL